MTDGLPPIIWKGTHNGVGVIDDDALQAAVFKRELAALAATLVNKASAVSNLAPPAPSRSASQVELPDLSLELRDVEGTGLHFKVGTSRLLAHDEVGVKNPRFLFVSGSGASYFVVQRDKIRPLVDRLPRPARRPRGITTMAHGVKLHPDFDHSHSAEVEAHRLYENMGVHVVD